MAGTPWDGQTERRAIPDDHDKLTRLLVSVETHVQNFNRHAEEDKVNFKEIRDQIGKHAMWIYMAIGGVAAIQLLSKVSLVIKTPGG